MSDTTDAVREAMMRNKQLAARHLVRKQELEAELAKLRSQREGIDASLAADPAVVELDARIADRTTQLQAATYDYQQALNELGELDRLGTKALGLEARTIAASGRDPLIRSNEQIALDNVRERGADIDAQGKLAQELGELDGTAPIVTPAPAARKPTREESDASAAAEFAALRAKKQAPAAPSSDDDPNAPKPPVKKTL